MRPSPDSPAHKGTPLLCTLKTLCSNLKQSNMVDNSHIRPLDTLNMASLHWGVLCHIHMQRLSIKKECKIFYWQNFKNIGYMSKIFWMYRVV